MNFDETNKVILDSLNVDEGKAFIKFLYSEIARHEQDIEQAQKLIQKVSAKFRFIQPQFNLTTASIAVV